VELEICGVEDLAESAVQRAFHQMAQKIQRLTALAVSRLSKPGLYADGGGLYLRIGRNGSKSWTFRFTLRGRAREMGFGGLHKVSLADARKKANDARLFLTEGQDPLTQRHLKSMLRAASEKLEAARSMTFDQCADAYINVHQAGWKNEKHRQQWRNTIATYVSPVFGATPVQDVETDHIIQVIEPIWSIKTETARRLRGRIEVILDWAKVRGYRTGENPARWRGLGRTDRCRKPRCDRPCGPRDNLCRKAASYSRVTCADVANHRPFPGVGVASASGLTILLT
jgi:hypothetical protein